MSLSECRRCGGHVPLGPGATNRCEKCGDGVFVDHRGPASEAYDRIMTEAAKALHKYMHESPDLGMYHLIQSTAYERAARIVDEVGVKACGSKDDVLTALWGWIKDFEGEHLNFATWNRTLLWSMNLVSAAFRGDKP